VIGKETLELRHTAAVSAATVTSDGFRLIAVACDGTVTLWDATPLVHEPGRGPTRAKP
jgi:hypothetical protein